MGRYSSETQRPPTFTVNQQHPLAQGLVFAGLGAHAGSTRYHDSSVFGNTGAFVALTIDDWVYSHSLSRMTINCAAAGDAVSIADSASLKGMANLSVSAWIYARTAGISTTFPRIITKQDTTDYALNVTSSSPTNGFNFVVGGTVHQSANSAFVVTTWQHVCGVYDGAVLKVYVNGVQSGTTTAKTGAVPSSTNAMYLGNRSALNRTFDGYIADVLVHARALPEAEIALLADPSNVILSGLIQPPRRKWWPVVAAGGSTSLIVGDAAIVVTSESPSLTQHQVLTVADSACLVTSDTPSLIQHQVLAVSDSVCVVASDEPTLTHHPVGSMEVQDSACVVTSDSPTLTQHHVLSVGDAACVVTSDEPTLTAHSGVSLVPADSACVVTSDLVVLTQHHLLAVLDSKITVTSDSVTLGGVGYQPVVYYRPLEGPSKQLRILEGPSKQIKILRRE